MSVIHVYNAAEARKTILLRKPWEDQEMPGRVLDGIERIFGERLSPTEAVARILADVRARGDAALHEWSARIDGAGRAAMAAAGAADAHPAPGDSRAADFEIPRAAWVAAYARLPEEQRAALDLAAERIAAFHRKQPMDSWVDAGPDGTLGQLIRPLDRVGVYVPGGTAPLPSSLLMAVIPARVAGVGQVIVCTPPGVADVVVQTVAEHPERSPALCAGLSRRACPELVEGMRPLRDGRSASFDSVAEKHRHSAQDACVSSQAERSPADLILAAAHVAQVDRLFALGGAQAIAAMAYGTATVPAVDKIVGAGGLFVTLAKRQVIGSVGIDGFYGPTETLVIADESAHPAWVAADLLAQAEHDVLASPILLTPSRRLAEAVAAELAVQLERLSRAEIAAASLRDRGGIVITADLAEAVALANAYAPEHLCLLVCDPWALVGHIRNAGGVFVGEHSFEVLGDYVAGPSHVMPTEGSARYSSPLSVADFVKRISLVALSREAGIRLSAPAAVLARGEGLTAHAAAAERRSGQVDK